MLRLFILLLAVACVVLLRAGGVDAHLSEMQHAGAGHPGTAPPPGQRSAPAAGEAIIESGSHIQPPLPTYKFPQGQNYVYLGEWRLFNAGMATMRLENSGTETRIVVNADSVGAVALLYHVHDRMESVIDSRTFCSKSLKKHTEEGFRRVDSNLQFDYQQKKAFYDEKNLKNNSTRKTENTVPECVTDVIAGIFYAGTVPTEPGKQFSFPLNDGSKTVDVLAHVEAREEIKVPAGTYKTLRMQPEVMSGPLKGKGKVWVWYSDDGNHIPVQMRAKMFWGTLNFKLQRIEQSGK